MSRLTHFRGRPAILAGALGLLVVGAGTAANNDDDSIVTIRGRVAEIYGDKFVIADASGRALIETGREGEDGTLVGVGQPVTVQGRFDRGTLHAAFLVGADGKVKALGPLGRPPHDRGGPGGPDRGPGAGPD
ncbi:MAG: hypothetical protein EOP68_19955, partial [Sphingomonas sp.]